VCSSGGDSKDQTFSIIIENLLSLPALKRQGFSEVFDESEFWNEFSLVPVADQKGWYTYWIAVQRNTTARKRAHEIRLALEREKELSALKIRKNICLSRSIAVRMFARFQGRG
jgi:hypothetical protein